MIEQAPFYIYTAFIFSYGVQALVGVAQFPAHRRAGGLLHRACSRCRSSAISPTASAARKCFCIGTVFGGLFGFAYFAVLGSGVPALIFVDSGAVADPARHGLWTGSRPDRRMFHRTPALFRRLAGLSTGVDHRRRSGAVDRRLAGGALSLRLCRGGLYRACAVVSFVATAFLPDYTGKDISAEYENV